MLVVLTSRSLLSYLVIARVPQGSIHDPNLFMI